MNNPTPIASVRRRTLAGVVGIVLLLPGVALAKDAALSAELVDREAKALEHSATTATKIGPHELPRGSHRLEVRLVGNDHVALGPLVRLDVTIPRSPAR